MRSITKDRAVFFLNNKEVIKKHFFNYVSILREVFVVTPSTLSHGDNA